MGCLVWAFGALILTGTISGVIDIPDRLDFSGSALPIALLGVLWMFADGLSSRRRCRCENCA